MHSKIQAEKVSELIRAAKMHYDARARDDIIYALQTFTELKPCTVKHPFPDGNLRICVALSGTIPVNYRGATYHIPVGLYLMDNHPYRGPVCYVKPTPTMQIRVSETVDANGRIYLPYLTEWRYPGYDTHGLLQVMTHAFQEKCPVYSVSSLRPNLPTNPSSQSSTITPYPQTSTYPIPASINNIPYPQSNNTMPIPGAYLPQPNAYSLPQPNAYGLPQPNAYGPSPTPNSGSVYNPLGTQLPSVGYQPPYQLFPSPLSGSNSNIANQSTGSYSGYSNTIQPTHIRASLISAVEEKIRSRLIDKLGTPFAELQSVDINLQELRTGQQKLREMLERMEQEQKQLDLIFVTYQEKKVELEKALEACRVSETSESNSIDNAIEASTPLYRQITENYVQDCVIDDTIYFLGQALKKGAINLPTYMKYVRQLSQKQFKHRATVQKCRLKANLPI